jgi:hypothetical protein
MKLTQDEAFRLIDRVTDWLYDRVGQDVTVEQAPGTFTIKQEEKKNVRPQGKARPYDDSN